MVVFLPLWIKMQMKQIIGVICNIISSSTEERQETHN